MITFISGVDTDAGKSVATGWLAQRLMAQGRRVITQKLVQTGNVGTSEDIARHRAMMGCGTLPEDEEGLTAPEIYRYPCSPHLAARLESRRVNTEALVGATRLLAERYDDVLVEGAGGLMVPLTDDLLTIDFVQAQGWPVTFVTGGVLGSINHTLLAFEAMKARGLTVSRILYNRYPGRADRTIDEASCSFLRQAAARLFPEAIWEELPLIDAVRPLRATTPTPPRTPPSERPIVRTFPANLLLEGATALVVGGGRVGLRKSRTLLEAGARVRLVCPEALEDFTTLPVEHRAHPFQPDDLEGCRIVVACTDDKYVNRAILEAARAAQIPCCCADGHWAEGDFIVPATLRTEDLLIAISTHGRSCRTAKEVKDALARRLARSSPGHLFIHGLDRSVPFPPKDFLAERLSFLNGLYGWVFLTTCNRTELIAWASPELIASSLLSHVLHLPQGAYTFTDDEAMHHLSFVLAGMRAQMVGEFHIVGQVRDAFEEARTAGWANGALQTAYAEALRRAQAIRAAIAPHLPQIDVEALALEGAEGRIVVAGTGHLGRATVQRAHALGLEVTVLYHQKPLPGEHCLPLEHWQEAMPGANRLITCLSSTTPIFEADALDVPVYDLGSPRNVRGDRNVLNLDTLRERYLRRTGCLETLVTTAESAYEEVCRG